MAYIRRTKSAFQVRQGNTNTLLSTFTGKNASKRAKSELTRLHRKFHPKPSNRGKNAAKRFRT